VEIFPVFDEKNTKNGKEKIFIKNLKKPLAFFSKMVYYITVAPRGMLI